jgi:predicted RNA binding protein YcfA (HicA-like mRNA interferase family)
VGNKSKHKPIVTRKLIKLIERNGFINDSGTKHGKYVREGDDHKIMVPRHKKLTPGLSAAICKELVEKHNFTEQDVLGLF